MDNNKKRAIIFMVVFLLVLVGIFSIYLFTSKKPDKEDSGETSTFQKFNPFGTGTNINNEEEEQGGSVLPEEEVLSNDSIFQKLTDFAVAGAVSFSELRPIKNNQAPEETVVKTLLSPNTKEGKKGIQKILNESLSLKTPLVVDGVFGKGTESAIKEFQKVNNLTITGQIDTETNQFFFTTSGSNSPKLEEVSLLRYVERANGHIYEMETSNKGIIKVSNSTIPTIYEALFDNSGKTVIYRYLSEDNSIASYMATLGSSKGEFLPSNILDLSLTPDKNKFFYLTKTQDGVSGSSRSFGSPNKETFFYFPFTEWLSQIISDQKIYLTTKPSWSVSGSIYSLNKESGVLTKIFGNILGLTTLVDNSGNLILYSVSTKTGPRLNIYDIKNNTSSSVDLYGLPEKCVWTPNSLSIYCAVPNTIVGKEYPDSWYQGVISFDDYFVKIDVASKGISTLANSQDEISVDAIHLFLDKKGENLFFINKKDSTLWSLGVF